MGSYIYKAKKIIPFKGDNLAFMDFWYKPYSGYSYGEIPTWQKRFEVIGERFLNNWENGVKYVAFAPNGDDVWDKTQWCDVYEVEHFPVVIIDHSKIWENAFNEDNIICQVKSTKTGKHLTVRKFRKEVDNSRSFV